MVGFISLMMIGGLWKTARASSSGANFISLHRYRHDATNLVHIMHHQYSVHHFHSSSSATTLVDHLPKKSLHSNDRRIRPHKSYLQLSSTRSTTTTSSQTDTLSDDHAHDSHVELKPFNWPQLRDLFRSPTITDSGIILGSNSNNQQEEHYIPSDHPNLALFRRSLAAQEEYELHKIDLTNNWVSAYDYLVMDKFGTKFGFEKVREEDSTPESPNGYVYKVSPSLAEASQYTISNQLTYLRLVLNDFPYDVEENIEHWCLWKIGIGGKKCSKEGILREELSWAVKELQCLHADTTSGSSCILDKDDKMLLHVCESEETSAPIADTLYWVNPPHLQSMPNIHHAHMLVIRSDWDDKSLP